MVKISYVIPYIYNMQSNNCNLWYSGKQKKEYDM